MVLAVFLHSWFPPLTYLPDPPSAALPLEPKSKKFKAGDEGVIVYLILHIPYHVVGVDREQHGMAPNKDPALPAAGFPLWHDMALASTLPLLYRTLRSALPKN